MNTNSYKFLKWIMYAALAIIPFLAFYVAGFGVSASWNSLLFPYITGKNFGFRILVEIAAAAWVLLMILDKNLRPKKTLMLYIYSSFVFILLLADIFSVNITRSFLSNFERMEGFITHAHLFLYFLMLTSLFKDKISWAKYKTVLFFSNIPVIVLAFLQLLGLKSFALMKFLPNLRDAIGQKFYPSQGGTQLDASLGNSTYLAIYAVFFIFLFFLTYLETRKEKVKNNWIYLLMTILNLIVLYYTQTRGAQVGFAIGVLVTAIIIFFAGKKFEEFKGLRVASVSIVSALLVVYISLIAFGNSSFIQNTSTLNRLSKVSTFANPVTFFSNASKLKTELYNPDSTYESLKEISGDGTFTSRLINIKMSLEGFKERPILGWGQDNYLYVFAKHNDARMYAQEPWFDRTHNVFMDWLISAGALGLLAYLALYVGAIWMMWFTKDGKAHKSSNDILEKSFLTGLLVAYFIHNIFVFDNLISYLLFFIVLAYIASKYSSRKELINNKLSNQEIKSKLILFGPVILVILLGSLYFFNIKYYQANRYIIKGLVPTVKNNESQLDALHKSLVSFEKAIAKGGVAELESREQLAQTTLGLYNQIISLNLEMSEEYMPIYELVSEYVNQTKTAYEDLFSKKIDPRSLSIYASFLGTLGNDENSLQYSELAYKSAPNKQTIAINYIRELLMHELYEEANEIALKMYNSDKSYNVSQQIYALTSAYNGDYDKAESLLQVGNGVIFLDQSFLGAYRNTDNENRFISIIKNNLEINPEDIDSAVLLAQIYLEKGNNSEAKKILRELAENVPELEAEIEEYINSLD